MNTSGRRAWAVYLLAFVLICTGCSGAQFEQFRKKFIRTKKTSNRPVRFLGEPERRPNQELYREHFLYWDTWCDTLIHSLGGNRKRMAEALRESRRHLFVLPKYLDEEYADRMLPRLEEFDRIAATLKLSNVSAMRQSTAMRRLERLKLRIGKEFSFTDVKEHLIKDSVQLDTAPYEEELPEDLFLTFDQEKPVDTADEKAGAGTTDATSEGIEAGQPEAASPQEN